MKKIVFALFAVAGLAFTSCTQEIDDAFDTISSVRLEERMTECLNLLTSAENGWLIEYYPSSSREFGGSTFAAKFNADGSVTVTGDVAANLGLTADQTKTSHFSVKASSSVVLTFDTYNDYIHFWSDPDYFSENSYEGDFEWQYMSHTDNQMVFRGIKTSNMILFTQLDTDIVTAMQAVEQTKKTILEALFMGFKWTTGEEAPVVAAVAQEGDPIIYADDANNILYYYPSGDLNGEYVEIPFSFTTNGIRFYEEQDLYGVKVRQFEWDGAAQSLKAVDAKDASGNPVESAAMAGVYGPDFMHYDVFPGTYTFRYGGATGDGTSSRTVIITEKLRPLTYNMQLYKSGDNVVNVEVAYSKADGRLNLVGQRCPLSGSFASYYYYSSAYWQPQLWAWSQVTGGYIICNNVAGMYLFHNHDAENLVLSFADNGGWSREVDGFIIYRCPENTTTRSGTVLQIPYPKTLTKN